MAAGARRPLRSSASYNAPRSSVPLKRNWVRTNDIGIQPSSLRLRYQTSPIRSLGGRRRKPSIQRMSRLATRQSASACIVSSASFTDPRTAGWPSISRCAAADVADASNPTPASM